MAQKKNTWLWVGGALLAWYLLRKKIAKRSRAYITPGQPVQPGPPRRTMETAAQDAVTSVSFVPDMPTDREIYKESQKECK
jgi:hypothetical protein